MKLCIFSDIHGNIAALNKMLEREQLNIDYYLFLGDIFGYFYGQAAIIDKFMNIKNLWAVKGNHDENYIELLQGNREKGDELADKYGSSYFLPLSLEQEEYIRQLPSCLDIEIGGQLFGLFHGGPLNYLEQRIYPNTQMDYRIEKYDVLLLGHTHYRLAKKIGKTWIINPGSLGQPRDGKGFSYLILESEDRTYEFRSVEIDTLELIAQMREKDSGRKVFSYIKRKYMGL